MVFVLRNILMWSRLASNSWLLRPTVQYVAYLLSRNESNWSLSSIFSKTLTISEWINFRNCYNFHTFFLIAKIRSQLCSPCCFETRYVGQSGLHKFQDSQGYQKRKKKKRKQMFCLHVFLCTSYVPGAQRPTEGIRSLKLEVQLPCGTVN